MKTTQFPPIICPNTKKLTHTFVVNVIVLLPNSRFENKEKRKSKAVPDIMNAKTKMKDKKAKNIVHYKLFFHLFVCI